MTEEEMTSLLQKFEKKIQEQIAVATEDIPEIKTIIQGKKVISGLLLVGVPN